MVIFYSILTNNGVIEKDGTKKVKLTSNGMVSNWMFYLQRNDVNMRNEWSNYTNWPYRAIPGDLQLADTVQQYCKCLYWLAGLA
jgi:hypothetical protein